MTILVDGRFPFAPVVPTINNAPPVLRAPRLKTPAFQRNRRERREKLTIDNGQLTIIGATNIVHLYPSGKVCRERPMCRSARERTGLLPIKTRNVPLLCHSDRSVSGVEESTTWEKEPTQGKICHLSGFLGSLRSLGMTWRWVVPFCPQGL